VADFTQRDSYVKICGVTSLEDARTVINAGADALGLIFAESSRRLTLEKASEIANATKGSILRVGVFRHNDDDFVLASIDASGVDVAQIHGPLSVELITSLRRRDIVIVKALSIDDAEFSDFEDRVVDAVLIDGPVPGSGQSHAWDQLEKRKFDRPVIAAGGLTPVNVARVLETTGAWGADVSSGVESAPGVKDESRVRDFVMNARASFDQRGGRRV
jgi:phosphoribosylanthranilate isomerase